MQENKAQQGTKDTHVPSTHLMPATGFRLHEVSQGKREKQEGRKRKGEEGRKGKEGKEEERKERRKEVKLIVLKEVNFSRVIL